MRTKQPDFGSNWFNHLKAKGRDPLRLSPTSAKLFFHLGQSNLGQACPQRVLCEGVASRRQATRRPSAGDAPHEGLLKVERREFRCSEF